MLSHWRSFSWASDGELLRRSLTGNFLVHIQISRVGRFLRNRYGSKKLECSDGAPEKNSVDVQSLTSLLQLTSLFISFYFGKQPYGALGEECERQTCVHTARGPLKRKSSRIPWGQSRSMCVEIPTQLSTLSIENEIVAATHSEAKFDFRRKKLLHSEEMQRRALFVESNKH